MSNDIMKKLRKSCLTISNLGNDGNLQSVFSSLDILWVIYDKILKINKDSTRDNDIFMLSKGQASLGIYSILAEKGLFSFDEIKSFCKFDSRFGMQIDRSKFDEAGIEISAGSLGHGLPMAVGACMANKIKKTDSRVFVLVGDGEFNEGTMWEACILAASKKLNNLCVIIDDNNSIGNIIDMGDMEKKLIAFGFEVRIINGHNHNEIYNALSLNPDNKPLAVIAKTIRGYGCETMMKESKWFHRAPNNDELNILLKEVDVFEKSDV